MIESITGELIKKDPLFAYLKVGGIVLRINIPLSSYDKIGKPGAETTLLCHMYIREDDIKIFGFATNEEREIFRLLITVNKISCRIANQILSNIDHSLLIDALSSKNLSLIKSIPGVGEKLAGRMIVDLSDKISNIKPFSKKTGLKLDINDTLYEDSRDALISLGYKRREAEKAISKVLKTGNKIDDTADLIKIALKELNTI